MSEVGTRKSEVGIPCHPWSVPSLHFRSACDQFSNSPVPSPNSINFVAFIHYSFCFNKFVLKRLGGLGKEGKAPSSLHHIRQFSPRPSPPILPIPIPFPWALENPGIGPEHKRISSSSDSRSRSLANRYQSPASWSSRRDGVNSRRRRIQAGQRRKEESNGAKSSTKGQARSSLQLPSAGVSRIGLSLPLAGASAAENSKEQLPPVRSSSKGSDKPFTTNLVGGAVKQAANRCTNPSSTSPCHPSPSHSRPPLALIGSVSRIRPIRANGGKGAIPFTAQRAEKAEQMRGHFSALLQPAEVIAKIGIGASCLALCALLWSTHSILWEIEQIQAEIEQNAAAFRTNSERIWPKILFLASPKVTKSDVSSSALHHLVSRRDTEAKETIKALAKGAEFQALKGCQKCARMNCPIGPTGLPGQPGDDGIPGTVGRLGVPGVDGTDIQENPLPDMPCIVCPAGYPGLRGTKGERGLPGAAGPRGKGGPPGKSGKDGGFGKSGPLGKRGQLGVPGKAGAAGENIVGGIGVKGAPGQPGAKGPPGFAGLAGRPSKMAGQPGRQGPRGPTGMPGEPGPYGVPGPQAPPGEIGQAANFCPMRCPNTARGQPLFVPTDQDRNNNEFVFPPILMMSHDDGNEEEEITTEEDKIVEKSERVQ
ncbi:hypothetical protein niasHT_007020 [Heterodera trifolii]|uniref:Uncharacterized protein n=1 Tax=Heterodera trifolii TaxID=157864 RepID=A0ABD2LYI1_9BILA